MTSFKKLAVSLCLGAALCGCDKEQTTPPPASTTTAAATATATATSSAKASATASAAAAPSAAASAALPAHLDGAVTTAAEGISAAPASADWEQAAEVTVTGSTRAGCTTKVQGSWFSAYCASDEEGLGHLKAAIVIAGLRPNQTTIDRTSIGSDDSGRPLYAFHIVTPYVAGTNFTVNLQWTEGHNLDLTVEWPPGQPTAPPRAGIVKQAPDRTK